MVTASVTYGYSLYGIWSQVRGLSTQPGQLELSAEVLRFVPTAPRHGLPPEEEEETEEETEETGVGAGVGAKAADEGKGKGKGKDTGEGEGEGGLRWVRDGEPERPAPARLLVWRLGLLRELMPRRYLLRRVALEFFLEGGGAHLIPSLPPSTSYPPPPSSSPPTAVLRPT